MTPRDVRVAGERVTGELTDRQKLEMCEADLALIGAALMQKDTDIAWKFVLVGLALLGHDEAASFDLIGLELDKLEKLKGKGA